MKKQITLSFLFISFLLLQNPVYAAKKAEKLQKIGCIDIQDTFEQLDSKGELTAELDARRDELMKERESMEAELAVLKKRMDQKADGSRESKEADLRIDIFNKEKALLDFIDQANEDLGALEAKLLAPVLEDIRDAIREVSKKYGYDMIIDKSTYVLYVDKEYDVTSLVIDELNKQYKLDTQEGARD